MCQTHQPMDPGTLESNWKRTSWQSSKRNSMSICSTISNCIVKCSQFYQNVIKDGSITNNRTRKVYAKYHTAIDSAQIHSRHDQVLIARLRSGHPQSLRGYLHHLNSDIDPVCPKCHKEDHILKHWLMISPIGGNLRQQEFQCHRGTLKWLATHSKAVATSARKTLVNFYI